MKKKLYFEAEKRLLDTDCIDSDDRCFRLRELFTTDIEGVESEGSVGSVFQKILLRFGQFLAGLVLTETESASGDACGLDGKEEIVVILPIEERHEVLQPLEAIVDKQVLFIMAHRLAKIHIDDTPTALLKLRFDHPMEVLGVHSVVRTECRGVVVEYYCAIAVSLVIVAEVGNQFGQLALKFYVEGLDDIKPSS